MVFQYDICAAEGIRYIISRYGEQITLEKVRRYALAPDETGNTQHGSVL